MEFALVLVVFLELFELPLVLVSQLRDLQPGQATVVVVAPCCC